MNPAVTALPDTPIEQDLESEARRLLAEIERRGLGMRLLGGVAIRLVAGERLNPLFARESLDLDFIVSKGDCPAAKELLTDAGYLADEQFNALNGARRLLFMDPVHGRQIDVFVGSFEMCHELPLAERLETQPHTLPACELLMSKLQIVHLNSKDRGDLYSLLDSQELSALEPERIAALTANDWGLHHTFELNLERLRAALGEQPLDDDRRAVIEGRIGAIEQAMQAAPKSRRWKLRDRIGERKLWYDEPEEVDRDE